MRIGAGQSIVEDGLVDVHTSMMTQTESRTGHGSRGRSGPRTRGSTASSKVPYVHTKVPLRPMLNGCQAVGTRPGVLTGRQSHPARRLLALRSDDQMEVRAEQSHLACLGRNSALRHGHVFFSSPGFFLCDFINHNLTDRPLHHARLPHLCRCCSS